MFLAESAFDLENFRKYTPIPLLGICENASRPGVPTKCERARAALIAAVPTHSRHVRFFLRQVTNRDASKQAEN